MEPNFTLARHFANQPNLLMFSALPGAPVQPHRPRRSVAAPLLARVRAVLRRPAGANRWEPARSAGCAS